MFHAQIKFDRKLFLNSTKQSGEYSVQWNASDFPSGLYFVKLISTNERAEQKILFIK